MPPSALASPSSLKGVLTARAAAEALTAGFGRHGVETVQMPVADGGEGTLDVFHAVRGGDWREVEVHDAFGRRRRARWLLLPDGTAAVEAAEAIPLDPSRLDPLRASSRGLGELIAAVGTPTELTVCLGGTATVDGGAGLREVLDELPAPTRVACDALVPLVDAARVFARQKGARDEQLAELEARLTADPVLAPYRELAGAGAAGGLGAALAALGAELVGGADLVLDTVGLEPSGYDLVVTGEGTVDGSTQRGKAPAAVAARCRSAGVRCAVFGGRIVDPLPAAENYELSGDPARARQDLAELGERLALSLLGGA